MWKEILDSKYNQELSLEGIGVWIDSDKPEGFLWKQLPKHPTLNNNYN